MARASSVSYMLLAIAACAGCASRWSDFRVEEISGVEVRAVDRDGFDMEVRARVMNPNPLGARVSDIRFVASPGPPGPMAVLGRGLVPGPIEAPARGVFEVVAKVRVRYQDVPEDLPARVADGFLSLSVDAHFLAETRLGAHRMHARKTSRVAVGQGLFAIIRGGLSAPVVRVLSVDSAALGLGSVRLSVRVGVRNQFAFPIQVMRGEIELLLGQERVARSRFDTPFIARPRTTTEAQVEVQVTAGDMVRTARAIADRATRLRARGTLWIAPIGGLERIPFDVDVDPLAAL